VYNFADLLSEGGPQYFKLCFDDGFSVMVPRAPEILAAMSSTEKEVKACYSSAVQERDASIRNAQEAASFLENTLSNFDELLQWFSRFIGTDPETVPTLIGVLSRSRTYNKESLAAHSKAATTIQGLKVQASKAKGSQDVLVAICEVLKRFLEFHADMSEDKDGVITALKDELRQDSDQKLTIASLKTQLDQRKDQEDIIKTLQDRSKLVEQDYRIQLSQLRSELSAVKVDHSHQLNEKHMSAIQEKERITKALQEKIARQAQDHQVQLSKLRAELAAVKDYLPRQLKEKHKSAIRERDVIITMREKTIEDLKKTVQDQSQQTTSAEYRDLQEECIQLRDTQYDLETKLRRRSLRRRKRS
jgi:hypothetical protein